jgi:hypothetical protein
MIASIFKCMKQQKKSVFLLKEKVREIEEKKIDYRVKFTTEPNVIIGCLFVHVYIYIYIYVCAFACARLPACINCIWILSIVVLKVR